MHCKMPEALPENDILRNVTAVNNPLLWHSRYRLARTAILDWLKAPNVHVTIVEVAHGDRAHCLCDLVCGNDRVKHIEVYAKTMLGRRKIASILASLSSPPAPNISALSTPTLIRAFLDGLVRSSTISTSTLLSSGRRPTIWGRTRAFPTSFSKAIPSSTATLPTEPITAGSAAIPIQDMHGHGFRGALDGIGGLFELGGMGSGDSTWPLLWSVRPTALCRTEAEKSSYGPSMSGSVARYAPSITSSGMCRSPSSTNVHGDKIRRGYMSRWDMFLKHTFNPIYDLRRNSHGVLEFDGNKPELEREFDCYLRSRQEEANIIG